jgi:anaerobic magnesium-protoporphyrin IX monomethyl ester cyclase
MRVFVLNPPFLEKFSRASRSPAVTKSGTIYYPTWLAYATGVLEEAGHTVRLLDCPPVGLDARYAVETAREFDPTLVVVDSSTPSIANDLAVADDIKKTLPRALVVMVGPHVSAETAEVLLRSSVDAVARREYDFTLRDLAAVLDRGGNLGDVLGLSYRADGRVIHNPDRPFIDDLDALPYVSKVFKHHLRVEDYFYAHLQHPMVSLFTSRGCPAQCVWCMYPQVFYGHEFRHRSPENIVGEFRYISEELPQVREILIDDDTFTIKIPHVRRTCELLIEDGNRIPWTCQVRVNNLDFETMRVMKHARCRLVVAGFESGNSQILKNIKKGTTPGQGRQFTADARRAGLLVHGCFVAGQPGETRETLRQTLDYALSLDLDTAQFFPMMVYPGTEAFAWAKTNNYLTTTNYSEWLTNDGLHNTVIDLPGLSHDDLVAWCDYARRRFYLRPKYMAAKALQSLTSWGEFKRIAKSARRFSRFLFKAAPGWDKTPGPRGKG